jgi:[NiFe] hydrogenase assembly HybE family chaperone
MNAPLARRVARLESHFHQIAQERMRGLPVLHPGLKVQALGFELHTPTPPDGEGAPVWASGVLITPWFMNLLRLPLEALTPLQAVERGWLASGHSGRRHVGGQCFEFLGAHEGDAAVGELGAFECCSLFSPMFQFADHAAALATGTEVLRLLRAPATPPLPSVPARRGFLLGRFAAQGEGRR